MAIKASLRIAEQKSYVTLLIPKQQDVSNRRTYHDNVGSRSGDIADADSHEMGQVPLRPGNRVEAKDDREHEQEHGE